MASCTVAASITSGTSAPVMPPAIAAMMIALSKMFIYPSSREIRECVPGRTGRFERCGAHASAGSDREE